MSTIPEPPNIYIRPFVSDQVIELYWRPPDSDGGAPISSYILECSNIGFTQILSPSDNKIKISNLTNSLYYNFSLKATNINGNSNIAEFRTVQPGFPPDNPTGLDFTTSNFSDMPYVNFSFNNPVYTGNIDLTHNLVTLIPLDNSGNVLPNDYFKYYRSNYGFDNMREVKFEDINYNYNYKALIQSINDVNYSRYTNFIDNILNPNLPTNGLKLWLDPFDLTTITRDNNNIVTVWNDKSKNKYQATNLSNISTTIYNTRSFVPSDISGLQLWLDGNDPNGNNSLPSNGSTLTTWFDKSLNSRTATTRVGTVTYNSTNKGLVFNGSSAMNSSLTSSTSTEVAFIVLRISNITTIGTFLGGTSLGARQFRHDNQNIQTVKTSVTNYLSTSFSTVVNTPFLTGFTNNGTTLTHYVNGSSIGTFNGATYDAGFTTIIGCSFASGSNREFFNGTIHEILVFSSISTTDREKIEGYLAWKWGLQSNLPLNHPFKNEIPLTNIFEIITNSPRYDISNACIRFNGGQYLNLTPNSVPTANSNYSILFYADTSNIFIGSQYIFDSGNILSNSDVASYFDFNLFEHDSGNNLYIGNLSITSNITNLYEIYNDNGNISLLINGIIASTGRSNLRLSDISSNSVIGTNKNFTGNLFGSVGEIIMYDRLLTAGERNTVRNYLQFKENELILRNWGNLVVWLDANNPNNFFDSTISRKISYNSNVTTFIDRSGANNNAIANDLNFSTRRTVFNNFNIMNFANSYIQISRAYYPLDSFIVADLDSNTQINGVMGVGTSANNYNSLSFGRLQNSRWSIDSTSFSGTSINNETSSNLLLLEWNINNGNNFVNRNGTSLITNINNYTLPTNANIYIGNHNGFDFNNKLKGGIGEVISFNKQLSISDRNVLEGYLAWKYGLVTNLTNNHPYKDDPPYLFSRDLNIFTPKNPGNIILWYDASDSTNTIFSGNSLSNIFDKSLRNNNQITYSNNRPTRSDINGVTSLYLNSNSGNISYFSGNLTSNFVENVSVFIVGSMSNASNVDNPRLFELNFNNAVLENGMIVRDGANSNIAIHDVALEGVNGNIKLSRYYDYDIPFIYSMVLNRSNVTSYINGNLIGTSPPGIANYSPNMNSNIFLWFDSSDLSTMTISSNVVTQWRDKANINSNLILQPYDIYVGPNISNNGLVFNNFSTATRTAGQSGLSLNSNITIANTNKVFYFVYNNLRDISGNLNNLLQLRSTFTDNLQYNIDLGVTFPTTSPFVSNSTLNVFSNSSNWSTSNIFTILGVYFTPTNVNLRVNGVTITGITLPQLNAQNILYDVFTVGGHFDNRNFTGTISEILVYDGLTISDTISANKIEGYLAYKWNLLNNLTSNHLYYPGYNRWGIGGSGLNNSTFQNGWTGKIGEVIAYSHAIDSNFRQSIEGYLAYKWNLFNYLPSNHLYKLSKPYLSSYSTTGQLFSPTDVSGLRLWLDATDASSFVLSGNSVVQWRDKSRFFNHFTSVGGSPTRITDGNRTVVNFTSGPLLTSTSSVLLTTSTRFLCVSRTTKSGMSYVLCAIDGSNDRSVRYDNQIFNGGFSRSFNSGDMCSDTIFVNAKRDASITTDSLNYHMWDGTFSLNLSSRLQISSTFLSRFFVGQICEFLVYDSLDTTNYPILQGYLAWKWGLQSNLPFNHPFKNAAPLFNISYGLPSSVNLTFHPTSISGLALWFDANDISTFVFSSSNIVSSWSTKLTTPIVTVSQPVTTLQPQRISNALNNLAVLRTININSSSYASLYNTSVPSTNLATSTSVCIFIVHNPTFNNSTPISFQNSGSNRISMHTPENDSIAWDWNSGSSFNRLNFSLGSGGGAIYRSEGFKIECFYVASGIQGYRKNGQLLRSISSTTASFATNQALTVGGFAPDSGSYFYRSDLAEIIWYRSTFNINQIEQVEGYLAWKWGLQSLLPSNHSFKNAAPTSTENYISGFIVRVYDGGYFSDNVNWFTSQTVNYTSSNITDMTNISTATNSNKPVNVGDNYSVQWTGYFYCKVSGNHTFFTNSDDASYLWLGSNAISDFTTGNPVVNNGGAHAPTERSGTINLTAGVYYPIRMQYGEGTGTNDMQVSFTDPTGVRRYDFSTYAFNQGNSNFS